MAAVAASVEAHAEGRGRSHGGLHQPRGLATDSDHRPPVPRPTGEPPHDPDREGQRRQHPSTFVGGRNFEELAHGQGTLPRLELLEGALAERLPLSPGYVVRYQREDFGLLLVEVGDDVGEELSEGGGKLGARRSRGLPGPGFGEAPGLVNARRQRGVLSFQAGQGGRSGGRLLVQEGPQQLILVAVVDVQPVEG